MGYVENKEIAFEINKKANFKEILPKLGYTIDRSEGLLNSNWTTFKSETEKIIISNRNPQVYFVRIGSSTIEKGNLFKFFENRQNLFVVNPNLSLTQNFINVFHGNIISTKPLSYEIPSESKEKKETIKLDFSDYRIEPLGETENKYLLNQRGIESKYLNHPTFQNTFFRGNHKLKKINNIAFKFFEEPKHTNGGLDKIKCLLFHYTKPFNVQDGNETKNITKVFTPGEGKGKSFWFSNVDHTKPIDNIILCESPIDAVSHFVLHQKLLDGKNNLYVAFGGNLAKEQMLRIRNIILDTGRTNPNAKTILAFDNDLEGSRFSNSIINGLTEDTLKINRIDNSNSVQVRIKKSKYKDFVTLLKDKIHKIDKETARFGMIEIEARLEEQTPQGMKRFLDSFNNMRINPNIVIAKPTAGKDFNDQLMQLAKNIIQTKASISLKMN